MILSKYWKAGMRCDDMKQDLTELVYKLTQRPKGNVCYKIFAGMRIKILTFKK